MKITESKAEGLKHTYTVVIPQTQLELRLNERLTELAKSAKIPGFRPGKAPLPILKQRYGVSAKGEVLEKVIQDGVQFLLDEKKIKPALRPKVDIKKFEEDQDIEIEVVVEALPEIKPIKIEELSFERSICDVPQAKLDEAYENLKNRSRTPGEAHDKAAQKGDVTIIDFVGRLTNGTAIEGGSGNNTPLELGSGSFIPGFEDQLVGAKAGDEVTVKVAFPKDYHAPTLAGQDAIFDVTVREVRSMQTPEMDDKFAADLGMKDLKTLQNFIKEQIEGECKRMSLLVAKRQILDYFAENVKFEVPQGLVDLEFDTIWQQHKNHLDEAIKSGHQKPLSSKEEEKEKKQYRDIAERRVRLGLLLADIGRQYEVQVTQRELENAIMQTARQYPGQERQIFDYFRNNKNALASLRAPIFEDKVIELITDKAKMKDNKVSFEELEKLVHELTEGDDELASGHMHDDGHVHGPNCNHDHD